MIKKKNRLDLIEEVYKLIAENERLLLCLKEQEFIIKDISDTIHDSSNLLTKLLNFITKPFRVAKIIKQHEPYFYDYKLNNMNKLTEDQIIKSLSCINSYQAKKFSWENYKTHIVNTTGIKICPSCGNVRDKLHNDFQNRIMGQIRRDHIQLVKSINFVSGKYASGDYFMNSVPYMSFNQLNHLINKMKTEQRKYQIKGINELVELLNIDINTLNDYINDRLDSAHILDINGNPLPVRIFEDEDECKPVTTIPCVADPELIKVEESIKDEIERMLNEEDVVDEPFDISNMDDSKFININDFNKPFKSGGLVPQVDKSNELGHVTNKVTPEQGVEHTVSKKGNFDLDKALELKDSGMSVTNIAKEMGYSRGYVSRKLSK